MLNHLYRSFKLPLKLFGFWLVFFAAFRLWFILWFHELWSAEAPGSVWPALLHGMKLDLSVAGYLVLLPSLLWFAGVSGGARAQQLISKIILSYNFALIAILIGICGANVFIYEDWHTVINGRALAYMKSPAAMFDSMSVVFMAGSVLAFLLFFSLFVWLYKHIVGYRAFDAREKIHALLWSPVQAGLLLLAIRGGLGVMPINESAVYYSGWMFNNQAATNSAWHLVHSLVERRSTQNRFRTMSDEEAAALAAGLFPADTLPAAPWLQSAGGGPPNIVVVLMESMGAQVLEELGGEPGVCPNLGALIREGILLEQCYSSGFRTDQGLVSILGGYPAQPDQSIVLLEDKAATLSSIPRVLKDSLGYESLFCYGGGLTFANIGSWLYRQGFSRVLSQKDFDIVRQRWGADDATVLQRFAGEVDRLKQPFFASVLTLSLHAPYDVPHESRWDGASDVQKFLHAASFADKALGDFMQRARSSPWYANTLFVFVADHGHCLPAQVGQDQPLARHMPLILAGPAVAPAWRGKRVGAICNHHDLPATLMAALGRRGTFPWSRDVLPAGDQAAAPPFAYYTNEDGLGWVTPQGAGFYRFNDGKWHFFRGALDEREKKQAQAYLQALYNDFLAR